MLHLMHRVAAVALALSASIFLTGCVSYMTPGGPADLHGFEDPGIADIAARKPEAHFPANMAVARIQSSGYRSYTANSFGHGRYSLVTTRDVETETQFERIGSLPQVAGLTTINRMLLPNQLDSDRPLREAAAAMHADLLLLYTFDTQFETDEVIPAAGLLTLGLFPDRQAKVASTASALLVDVRSGYIYGALETTERAVQPANFWTSEDAADDARRRAEAGAFEELVGQFESLWPRIVATYATPGGQTYSTK